MARLLVLTDRAPNDPDWKGALTWQIILSLAESQHEVLVATPLPLESIELTHPRLTVTRPLNSWRVDQIGKLGRILITYQPEIIHTFALKTERLWPSLTVWPYAAAICKAMPRLRRFSTLFDDDDLQENDANVQWHKDSTAITVFSENHRLRVERALDRPTQILPLEFELGKDSLPAGPVCLIPAPVSEWLNPLQSLLRFAKFAAGNPELSFKVIGGWGQWTGRERKEGWRLIGEVGHRVSMLEPLNFDDFRELLLGASSVWLEALDPYAWKFQLAAHLSHELNKKLYYPGSRPTSLETGSTANSLSRLYSHDAKLT